MASYTLAEAARKLRVSYETIRSYVVVRELVASRRKWPAREGRGLGGNPVILDQAGLEALAKMLGVVITAGKSKTKRR